MSYYNNNYKDEFTSEMDEYAPYLPGHVSEVVAEILGFYKSNPESQQKTMSDFNSLANKIDVVSEVEELYSGVSFKDKQVVAKLLEFFEYDEQKQQELVSKYHSLLEDDEVKSLKLTK